MRARIPAASAGDAALAEELSAPAVDVRNLVKHFGHGSVRALDDASITIRRNEFFTLLGPSGCGKTTLLRTIGGFSVQDSGTVLLHGAPLDGLPPHRRPVNTVFQSYAVFPHLTVARNIAFGQEMQRRPRAEIAAGVAEMLALVKLDGLGGRRAAQLSGGQLQRVALARALACRPRVLLLDEPLAALDLKLRTEMQLELKRLQAEVGITFIFVTHDQHEALTMSDRIAVMRAGRIEQVGTPQEIYERPTTRFVADFIGETNLLEVLRVGPGRYRLASGVEIAADASSATEAGCALAIRPERAVLVAPGAGLLSGRVQQVVYMGTDTSYHLTLDGIGPFRVRGQNRGGASPVVRPGDAVGVALDPDAVWV
ncbi:MAG TPA: ABC transporter ATP-binding protein, partial [Acetobacteraceae bacterium]|nr:ABC transporter ATP-binding protein [Acetobacteraceae bacterium]